MSEKPVDRREFAKSVAFGASLVSVTAWSDVPAAETKDSPPTDQRRSPAELVLELLRRQYPDERLTEAVLANIRGDIYGDLARSRALRRFPLKNSDEPAFVFAAYRADDGMPDSSPSE